MNGSERIRSWRRMAELLYAEGNRMSAIAAYVGVSQETISAYLQNLPGWDRLRQEHKEALKKRRAKSLHTAMRLTAV